MNSVLSSIEHRETPFLHGFECVVEYVPSNQRVAEYVDQYLSLYRVPNRGGSGADARIVAIRLSRVSELVAYLTDRRLLNASSPLSYQALLVAARELAKPQFRHIEIYDVVQEIVASTGLTIEPDEWRVHANFVVAQESSPEVADDAEPLTTKATPRHLVGRSSQPSIPDDEASSAPRRPPPRKPQPSSP